MKKVKPFSNATEATFWLANNCEQCKRSNCSARRNIEFGFISGEITLHAAKFIGGEVHGSFLYINQVCNGFTYIANKKKKLINNELPTLLRIK